jgi:branched-chain amino acid transport system substrate-binding protein
MKLRHPTAALLVLAVAIAVAGCPPTMVIRDGKNVTVAEATRNDLAEARALAEAGKTVQAIAAYHKFIKEFPDAKDLDQALAAAGKLLVGLKRHTEAVEVFQRLVSDYPGSKHYLACAVQLGLSLAELGRTAEALPTLQSIFDQLPDQKRQAEVASMLASSYEASKTPVEAIRWYAVFFRLTADEATRDGIRMRVSSMLDRDLTFLQVREAVEVLDQVGEKKFPADLLRLKLSKIYFHIYDFDRARANLERFVATWPKHPLSGEAGQLLKKILDRDRVHPATVGVLLPLTGKFRAYGQKALAGIQLGAGIFEEPKPGQVSPVLIIRDTAGDPEQAAKHMEDLVYNEHAVAIIGPVFSAEAFAAAVKAQELQVPIITLSLREDIPEVGDQVFRNFLTLAAQAKLLVKYATEKLGVKRFAVLYPNDKYGVGFINSFWDEVKKRKGEIRAAERYEPDAKNFAKPIKKMVGRYWLEARWDFIRERSKIRREFAKKPLGKKRAMEALVKRLRPNVDFQAIFIPEYHEKVAMIAPALAFEDIVVHTTSNWKKDRLKKSLGRDKLDMVYLLGGNGWNNHQLVEWAERYVQGAIFCDGFFAASSRPATRRFVGLFKTHFDREPDWVEAHAYDTAFLVRGIIEKQNPKTRTAFRQALLDLRDFDGATGKTHFEPNGEAEKELFLLTIKREEIEEIQMEPAADAGT